MKQSERTPAIGDMVQHKRFGRGWITGLRLGKYVDVFFASALDPITKAFGRSSTFTVSVLADSKYFSQ